MTCLLATPVQFKLLSAFEKLGRGAAEGQRQLAIIQTGPACKSSLSGTSKNTKPQGVGFSHQPLVAQ